MWFYSELKRDYPQFTFSPSVTAVYEEDAGILRAEKALIAYRVRIYIIYIYTSVAFIPTNLTE